MKIAKIVAALAMLLSVTFTAHAQTKKETIKVYGNCGMCQKTIETAAKKAGATSAKWNKTTKMMTVTFDEKKTSKETIQKTIAAAGYDTEQFTADEKAYNNLHECCQYERKTNK